MKNQPLKCGDVVFVNLPSHNPKGHEQEGRRPAVIVGIPLEDVRYPILVVVPLTTQFHIDRDNLTAKFWLQSVRLSQNIVFPAKELRKLQSMVIENQTQLLEAWHEYFSN